MICYRSIGQPNTDSYSRLTGDKPATQAGFDRRTTLRELRAVEIVGAETNGARPAPGSTR